MAFYRTTKIILKFVKNGKGPQGTKAILGKKNKAGSIVIISNYTTELQ